MFLGGQHSRNEGVRGSSPRVGSGEMPACRPRLGRLALANRRIAQHCGGLDPKLIWADTSRVSHRVQVGLLATAALASLAAAGTRIAHAVRGGSTRQFQIPVYGTTPAAEAATLRAVRVPLGFRRVRCATEGACFYRREPVALAVAPVRHLAKDLGVSLAPPAGHPAVECGLIGGRVCRAEATIGSESVWVWVDHPEVRTHERRTPRNGRTFRAFRSLPGIEVEVSVIGHCLHPRECEEDQREEAREAAAAK